MTLFADQGYAGTTVPQIAEAAGLTTRTFFRHFSDKRDVLFLRDREFPQAVSEFMASIPQEYDGTATVRAGLAAACRGIQGWREQIARRRSIIHSEPALHERDLLRSHHLALAIEQSLTRRGVEPRHAHTSAALAVTCFDLAMDRWLEGSSDLSLEDALTTVWNDIQVCIDSSRSDTGVAPPPGT